MHKIWLYRCSTYRKDDLHLGVAGIWKSSMEWGWCKVESVFWKPDRTGRFDRLNREPAMAPVRFYALVDFAREPVKTVKTGEPCWTGLNRFFFIFTFCKMFLSRFELKTFAIEDQCSNHCTITSYLLFLITYLYKTNIYISFFHFSYKISSSHDSFFLIFNSFFLSHLFFCHSIFNQTSLVLIYWCFLLSFNFVFAH